MAKANAARGRGPILIGLGANLEGPWGRPREALGRAIEAMGRIGIRVRAVSALYETAPLGAADQPPYVNAVAAADSALPPGTLLRRLKRLERLAGRRAGARWGPRALDLDILDYKGRVKGWRGGRPPARRPPLVLPHPRLHERPFVLRPLQDVAPRWRHPALGRSARTLWRRLARAGPGAVLRRLP